VHFTTYFSSVLPSPPDCINLPYYLPRTASLPHRQKLLSQYVKELKQCANVQMNNVQIAIVAVIIADLNHLPAFTGIS